MADQWRLGDVFGPPCPTIVDPAKKASRKIAADYNGNPSDATMPIGENCTTRPRKQAIQEV